MRPRGITPEPQRTELLDAAEYAGASSERLRQAVRDANAAGGSIRDIAGLLEVSTNTIQRWLREGESGA